MAKLLKQSDLYDSTNVANSLYGFFDDVDGKEILKTLITMAKRNNNLETTALTK